MDIAALSTIMGQSQALSSANVSVLKIAMDAGKESASGMIKMLNSMPSAPHPYLGYQLDIKA